MPHSGSTNRCGNVNINMVIRALSLAHRDRGEEQTQHVTLTPHEHGSLKALIEY